MLDLEGDTRSDPVLDVRILGSVPSVRNGSATVELLAAPGRVFTALVLHGHAPVPKSRLARLVWGAAAGSEARLYRAVRELRSAVRVVGLDRDVDSVPGVGYRLRARPMQVDVALLEARVRRAEESLGRNDIAGAIDEAQRAEHLWSGYPAVDVPRTRDLIRKAFAVQLRAGILRERLADDDTWRRAKQVLTPEDSERVTAEVLFACVTRADALLRPGDVVGAFAARALLVALLRWFPGSAEARSLLSYADWLIHYKSLGSPRSLAEVEADARTVLEVRPDCLSARLTMTRIQFEHGRGEAELCQAQAAITTRPHGAAARRVVARSLVDTGQSAAAVRLLDSSDADRADPRSLEILTYAYLHCGRYELAVATARSYIERAQMDGNIAWGMALALIHLARYGEAKRVLLAAIERERDNVSLWVQLANAFACGDNKVRARQLALHALATLDLSFVAERSSNLRAVAWYVELLGQAGMHDRVDRLGARIRAEAPHNGYLAYRIGLAYGRSGRTGPALALLEQAAKSGFCSVEQLRQEVRCIPELARAPWLRHVVDLMNSDIERLRTIFTFDIPGDDRPDERGGPDRRRIINAD